MTDELTKRIDALKAEIHGATQPARPYFCVTVGHDSGAAYYRRLSADDPFIPTSGDEARRLAALPQVPTPQECAAAAATWWSVTRDIALRDYKEGRITGERCYGDGRTYAKYTDGAVKRVTW